MIFSRKRREKLLPKKTGKPLSSRDVLIRLRECWDILSPRRPCALSDEDLELVGYNMKLAELYNELRPLDSVGAIGFGGDQSEDNPDEDDESEKWYYAEIYCKGRTP